MRRKFGFSHLFTLGATDMNILTKSVILVGAVFSSLGVAGCLFMMPKPANPLPMQEVDALTTCKDTDLATIKKNLLLNGYTLESQDGESLVTQFKQVEGGGTEKGFERFNVVKVDERTLKFRVRVRNQSVQRVQTGEARDYRGRVVATDSQLVGTDNEADQAYVDTDRLLYANQHRAVCGN
jgi:hypothetical protein